MPATALVDVALSLSASASADDLAALERFFDERGAPTFHEVSPLADPAVLPLLHAPLRAGGADERALSRPRARRRRAARRRAARAALLRARLRAAAEAGCTLAMMGVRAGSASQRNAERQGFRVAYTRVEWQRMTGA